VIKPEKLARKGAFWDVKKKESEKNRGSYAAFL
jgi:hypothetical protein